MHAGTHAGTHADVGPPLRHAFGIPEDVAWLNAAARSPLPAPVAAAMASGLDRVRSPWLDRGAGDAAGQARTLAADLIGASPRDIAIVGSVSAGMAVAARNLPVAAGSRILLLAGEHPSAFLTWQRVAAMQGAVLDVVAAPGDGDWTAAVEARLQAPGEPPVSVASLCQVEWTRGGTLDLGRCAGLLRRHGAALVVDATQSAGIVPIDLPALAPDFLMFSTYKWLGGPYGLAFLYVAPARQGGWPVEETMLGREGLAMADGLPGERPYRANASRFDRGQRDDWVVVPAAAAAIGFAREWRQAGAVARIAVLMARLRGGLAALGIAVPPPAHSAPHIVGFRPQGAAASAVAQALARDSVFVSARQGFVRISLHAYCSERDVDRFLQGMRYLLPADPSR